MDRLSTMNFKKKMVFLSFFRLPAELRAPVVVASDDVGADDAR